MKDLGFYQNETIKPKVYNAIKYIVDAGVDPNFYVNEYITLLDAAIQQDTPNAVQYLIQKGADINLQTAYYKPPFIIALLYSPKSALIILENPTINLESIKAFLPRAEMQIDERTSELEDCESYEKIFNILVDKGISPDTPLYWQDTSAHIYASTIFLTIALLCPEALSLIKKMLEKGATLKPTEFNGLIEFNPLEYAERMKTNGEISAERRAAYKKLYELLQKYKKTNP